MYKVNIENKGGFAFTAKSGDYQFLINPKGDGVSPPETLLASLGSCIGVYIRKYCEGAKLDIKDFNVEVTAEFTAEKPVCFKEIFVQMDLKGFPIEERRKRSLLEFIKNCPVHSTLKSGVAINISLI